MKSRLLIICIVLPLAILIFFTPVFTGDATSVFVQKCGVCHQKGKEAAPVNPAAKAGVVWGKYFKRGRHPVKLASTINSEEMGLILDFLQDHAADSDHPVAAVIPK